MRKHLWLFTLSLFTLSAHAEDGKDQTLYVTGRGSATATASIAKVSVGIEVSEKTSTAAQSALAKLENSVLDALREAKAESVETFGFNLYPQYAKNTSPRVIAGYTANVSIRFECQATGAGKLIDIAINAGANQNQGVVLEPTDEAEKTARRLALEAAAEQALSEGKNILELLGLDFKGIRTINLSPGDPVGPSPTPRHGKVMAMEMRSIEVTEQEHEIIAEVQMEMTYE